MNHLTLELPDGTKAKIEFTSELKDAKLVELIFLMVLGTVSQTNKFSVQTSRTFMVKYAKAIVQASLMLIKRGILTDKLVSQDFTSAVDQLLNSLKENKTKDSG